MFPSQPPKINSIQLEQGQQNILMHKNIFIHKLKQAAFSFPDGFFSWWIKFKANW